MVSALCPPPAVPMFATQEQAMLWMERKVNEECVDNYRFAYNDDAKAIDRYNQLQNQGCCGFFDREVMVAGRLATIGCNYGH